MNTIVFLGSQKSGSSRDALRCAYQLGYVVCLITNNRQQIEDRNEYPEVEFMIYNELNNINDIKNVIKQLKTHFLEINAIISFVDPFCGLAAQLAKELGVENFTSDAMYLMENKLQSRTTLNNTHYNPNYLVINEDSNIEDNEIVSMLPVVLKYVESNGSKDVYFCKDLESYIRNKTILFNIYPKGTLIVEEYLNGPQIIVEVLTINNKVYIVAIIEQEITIINEHFIITGYNLLLNYKKEYYNKLKTAVNEIVSKFGLINGPCHLEMRIVNDNWKLIEINPRIAGAGMNQMLKTGLGINLVEETLRLALGYQVELSPKFMKNTFAEYVILDESGFLEKVTGKNAVMNCPGVEYVYIKPRKGSILTPPVSLGSRYAYVIATGDNEREARRNAKYAASKITFHLY